MISKFKKKSDDKIFDIDFHPLIKSKIEKNEQILFLLKSKFSELVLIDKSFENKLKKIRTSYKYLYVINWLYNCRGFIKLQSEPFDVDLFEIELLNNNNLEKNETEENFYSTFNFAFLEKLKLSLISKINNSKATINDFEKIFRNWYGSESPLGSDTESNDNQNAFELKFDHLSISDKVEIFYIIIKHLSCLPSFRTWIDKKNIMYENLRMNSIFSEVNLTEDKKIQFDYFLLFENNRLYRRTMIYNPLIVPKKKKNEIIADELYDSSLFDVKKHVEFDLIFKDLYELNDTLIDFAKKMTIPKYKTLHNKIIKINVIDSILESEIRKRKILSSKKKEVNVANILTSRKRSSRLEAKEKQKQDKLNDEGIHSDTSLKNESQIRLERRRKTKELRNNENTNSSNNIRKEPIKLRKLTKQNNVNYDENFY